MCVRRGSALRVWTGYSGLRRARRLAGHVALSFFAAGLPRGGMCCVRGHCGARRAVLRTAQPEDVPKHLRPLDVATRDIVRRRKEAGGHGGVGPAAGRDVLYRNADANDTHLDLFELIIGTDSACTPALDWARVAHVDTIAVAGLCRKSIGISMGACGHPDEHGHVRGHAPETVTMGNSLRSSSDTKRG
jgi:hypothetical protein